MVLDGRGLGQHLVPVEARCGLVRAEDVGDGHGVGRGRHPGQVEGGHVGGMVQHLGELPGEEVQLLLGEVEAKLADIHCPVLVLSSREDHVVESVSGDVIVDGVRGPVERVWLEESYHVATLDNDAPLIESRVVAFVASVFGGGA